MRQYTRLPGMQRKMSLELFQICPLQGIHADPVTLMPYQGLHY